MSNITIISSDKNWLVHAAVEQLKSVSKLPGVVKAIGLPDLHPGKTPVGAAIITENIIYPHLIGNDIGCGMAMFMTDLEKRKLKLERLISKLSKGINNVNFDEMLLKEINQARNNQNSLGLMNKSKNSENLEEVLLQAPEYEKSISSPLGSSLGTIGGGNHFAELQETESVFDEETFSHLGFDKKQIMLLVHSGSRGYGQTILDESIKLYEAQNGLQSTSSAAKEYLSKHDNAIFWAAINRELIAYRILRALGINTHTIKLVDSSHNSVSIKECDNKLLYIHRKGASPSDAGAVVIPGSRGSLTYLVMPSDNTCISGYSLAHGAGRKCERSMCKSRLENKYTKETIKYTKFKGRVICNDNNLLFEEAPEAYKNIDTVIQSLLDFGLIKVIATFKPILTYKNN
ncbi:RNA ligase RtcB family protein [Ruminiclostridium herbifermentans]|uniref:tRNA-splicing ligase RtcB n=1 Tax=Ruminiclostridium herbifermentans TaxID=2488810 RepID=A0A4U7JFP5_9FIRM|nr:RNA ligase RtcB family protein [Ruminiclostridium herbifermentans]QNU67528.1 RNA ligase RtcB family protein [Ruminiclostridium herbifermentans]